MRKMQAVILAGGLGTRLRPFTEKAPKAMFPVKGEPFVAHLLRLLKENGVPEAILCIGYLGQQVKDYLGNGEKLGLKVKYSEEKERLLGTGGALRQAQSLLDEHFYVINGDTYLPIDYQEVEKAFLHRGKKALMVVSDNSDNTGVPNNVELEGLMVTRHQKQSGNPRLRYVDAGVLALQRRALDIIKEGTALSLEEGLYPLLIQERELAAYITKQKFYDIGTLEQLRIFEDFLTKGQK